MPKVTLNPLPAPMRPEDLGGESAVFLVKEVLVDQASDRNRRGKVTVITVWESDKGIYLNESSKAAAIAGFKSDMSEEWKDKPFPVIKVHSTFKDAETGRETSGWKVWVAPAENWPAMLKAHKAQERQKKASK